MAVLHIMVGLPCSGKTTFARQLSQETGALLLTPDCWHKKLFGNDMGDEDHDRRHSAIEGLMWEVAAHVLRTGGDVILDFGFWSKEERQEFRRRAEELGAGFQMHAMIVPYPELLRRLEKRNACLAEDVFPLSQQEMAEYWGVFQPPDADE